MKNVLQTTVLCLSLLTACAVQAQSTCVRVEEGKTLTQEDPAGRFPVPASATRLVVHLPGADLGKPGLVLGDSGNAALKPGSDFIPSKQFIDKVRSGLEAIPTDRSRIRIAYVDASG